MVDKKYFIIAVIDTQLHFRFFYRRLRIDLSPKLGFLAEKP